MCPDRNITMPRLSPRQASQFATGFALVSAIFLITVLAALAAFIAYFSSTQQASSEADLLGARAFQAARGGMEWGSYQSIIGLSCPGAGAPTNLNFAGSSLAAFTVTVTCDRKNFTEGGNAITIDHITANACNQPVAGPGTCPNAAATGSAYVERQLSATVGAP